MVSSFGLILAPEDGVMIFRVGLYPLFSFVESNRSDICVSCSSDSKQPILQTLFLIEANGRAVVRDEEFRI